MLTGRGSGSNSPCCLLEKYYFLYFLLACPLFKKIGISSFLISLEPEEANKNFHY